MCFSCLITCHMKQKKAHCFSAEGLAYYEWNVVTKLLPRIRNLLFFIVEHGALQAWGRRFDPVQLHHYLTSCFWPSLIPLLNHCYTITYNHSSQRDPLIVERAQTNFRLHCLALQTCIFVVDLLTILPRNELCLVSVCGLISIALASNILPISI